MTTFVNIFGIPIPETKRGDLGRSPMFTQTDLNLSHKVKFGNDSRFAIAFDFNVLTCSTKTTRCIWTRTSRSHRRLRTC